MKKIICMGSATKDIFIPLKETTVINNSRSLTEKKYMAFEYGAKIYADKMYDLVGGSAVNVAAGLTNCGQKAFVFSRVDKGELGKWILKKISRLKIKKNYMQQNGGQSSEASVIVLDEKTIEHFILRTGDSVENFDLNKATSKFREKIDWFFIGSQKKGWQKNFDVAIKFAQKKNAKLALNPSGYQIEKDSKQLSSYLKEFELVFINKDEAIELVENCSQQGSEDIVFLFKKIADLGTRNIVITDAENGAYCWSEKTGILHLGISVHKKVDSTGAGDAFASGFLSSFIEEGDLKKALCFGIANSGSVVSKIGSTEGLLKSKELKQNALELINKVRTVN